MKRVSLLPLLAALVPPLSALAGAASDALPFDSAAWRLDEEHGVFWQVGVPYCARPEAPAYESLALYVPADYFDATDNGDGTWSCRPDPDARVAGFACEDAPVVLPLNTGGYAAQPAATNYAWSAALQEYLDAGLVYCYAGCRGRDNGVNADGTPFEGGAPWGVVDLKAAIRFLRLHAGALPGGARRVFSFGHSGGGAQSALLGATGDCEDYRPYLVRIGAAMADDDWHALSDAVTGAQCWCPITDLDCADAAYEWMIGSQHREGVRATNVWTGTFSERLAVMFTYRLNARELRPYPLDVAPSAETAERFRAAFRGPPLSLDWKSPFEGSYVEYLRGVVETSLNHFLADTSFPWTSGADEQADARLPGGPPPDFAPGKGRMVLGPPAAEPVAYATAADYIAALNADETWIDYDPAANTAKVRSLWAFVRRMKPAQKNVPAFDDLDRAQAENALFGNGRDNALHFDVLAGGELPLEPSDGWRPVSSWVPAPGQEGPPATLRSDWFRDVASADSLGVEQWRRRRMYNPMSFLRPRWLPDEISRALVPGEDGIAPHWRIRTGIRQGDTSLSTEVNLALALIGHGDGPFNGRTVDFETVWEKGHVPAERTGTPSANFIAWVRACCGNR
jgi:hypothetical protein